MKKIKSIFLGTRIEALNVVRNLTNVKKIYTLKNSYISKKSKGLNIKIDYYDCFKKEYLFRKIYNEDVDLIFSCGFSYIIPAQYIRKNIIMLNSHPSLLPNYKGPKAILDAFNDKCDYIGVSVHKIEPEVDSGKIIFKQRLFVKNMSLQKVYKYLFSNIEPRTINISLRRVFKF